MREEKPSILGDARRNLVKITLWLFELNKIIEGVIKLSVETDAKIH